jgi:hypothetical protein
MDGPTAQLRTASRSNWVETVLKHARVSLKRAGASALAALIWSVAPSFARAEGQGSPPAAWIQLIQGGAQIRTVIQGLRCPVAKVDGAPTLLKLRTVPDAAFPAVCQADLPKDPHRVELGGLALSPPVPVPHRIVIFGDSGCRLQGANIQACNDPRAWPFATVARRAAARKPDLVIHVGDYYYRETPCPGGDAGCAGSPHGDSWAAWQADFFAPAAPLLHAAPWLFIRGNHELCGRGGPGWFRLLDAAAQAKSCPTGVSDPMAIDVGGFNLYALDSADAEDRSAPPGAVAEFRAQLDRLEPLLAKAPGWIVTHRPVWGLAPLLRFGPIGPLDISINTTEQRAVRGENLGGVQMVVSGHIHDFASFDFGPTHPAQLIVGTGGDIGEPADTPRIQAQRVRIDGAAADWLSFDRFGYLVLDRHDTAEPGAPPDWTGTFYDADDRPVVDCHIHERALRCAAARSR